MIGTKPPERKELPKIRDRISFLYVEQCKIEKKDSAIRIITQDGTIDVPAGVIIVLMLVPGTTITHRFTGSLYETQNRVPCQKVCGRFSYDTKEKV